MRDRLQKLYYTILLVVLGFSSACTQSKLPEGSGVFNFSDHPVLKDTSMRIFYHRPLGDVSELPILFVMHGVQRNADTYRDNWVELSERYKILVIVPEFTKELFPSSRSYNHGNILSRNGAVNEEDHWSFSAIDAIFEKVVLITGNKSKGYDLFGHSAGSQFAHRFFLFKENTKVNRVIAANAGAYTMLDSDIEYPYGTKKIGLDEERLKNLLGRELVVQLGENDTDPKHRNLNVTPEAMRQGVHRLERGENFYREARQLAQKLQVDFKWQLRKVPGVAHDNAQMAQDIVEYLYSNDN